MTYQILLISVLIGVNFIKFKIIACSIAIIVLVFCIARAKV